MAEIATDLPSVGTLVLRELAAIAPDAQQLQKVFRKAAAMSESPEAAAAAFVESLQVMARHRIKERVVRSGVQLQTRRRRQAPS